MAQAVDLIETLIVGDGNGLVSVTELQNYVMRAVPKMTKGRQHPTVPFVDNLRNYPIARQK